MSGAIWTDNELWAEVVRNFKYENMFTANSGVMKMTDDELKLEYQRLVKAAWDRNLDIAKRRKERHEKINFDNPAFAQKIKNLEQEMKDRGLK